MANETIGALAPHVRPRSGINWRGLWTLYLREVQRFLKVGMQTIAAPVVTTLLFLAIFLFAMGGQQRTIAGVPFLAFLAPGLIMMAMVQNAFANTTSSLMIAKFQGSIVDLLMPPLSPMELTLGLALGGVTRGLFVGLVVAAAMALVVPLGLHDPGLALFHAFAAALMMSVLGIIAAIWADKFDHIAAVTNFIVTPLSFLSGTFYSIRQLPPAWQEATLWNPFFYMIDGFRAGFIGRSDGSVGVGIAVMAALDAALLALCCALFARGWKLKA
jgi:ABC-2 type transport system permease protein